MTTTAFVFPPFACGNNVRSRDASVSPVSVFNQGGTVPNQNVPVYTYEVVNTWSHDPKAFTQGLVFFDGWLYESTGRYGSSTLRRVDLRTGQVTKKVSVSEKCFAEGITIFNGKLYQLTWTDNKVFVYGLKSMRVEDELSFEGEGWGLTHDQQSLILSDGTSQLQFLDPITLKLTRTISVKDNGAPLMNINELEFIKGEIYANVWKTDRIARIDPLDGKILGWIDLSGLLPLAEHTGPEDVLNGIAYDEKNDRLFVTGKRWPKIFEIRLKPKA